MEDSQQGKQEPPAGKAPERRPVNLKLDNLPKRTFENEDEWGSSLHETRQRHNSILVTESSQAEQRAKASGNPDIHPHFIVNAPLHRQPNVWADRAHFDDAAGQGGGQGLPMDKISNASTTSVASMTGRRSAPRIPSGVNSLGSRTASNVDLPLSPSTSSVADPHESVHQSPGGTAVSRKAISPAHGTTATTLTSSSDPRIPQDDGKIHILLGATGSLHIYHLRNIIHKLQSIYGDRLAVQVILTKAAAKMLLKHDIPSNVHIWHDEDEWDTWKTRSDPVVHIELRRWADILVVVPLSANTLGKVAMGLCDNLLTNVIRAWNAQYPILVAPAMVSHAYNHPATRWHLKTIKDEMKWIEVLRPTEKVVGSLGDIGLGGMMPWNEIVDKIVHKLGGYPEEDDDDDEDRGGKVDDNDEDDDDEDDDDNDNGPVQGNQAPAEP